MWKCENVNSRGGSRPTTLSQEVQHCRSHNSPTILTTTDATKLSSEQVQNAPWLLRRSCRRSRTVGRGGTARRRWLGRKRWRHRAPRRPRSTASRRPRPSHSTPGCLTLAALSSTHTSATDTDSLQRCFTSHTHTAVWHWLIVRDFILTFSCITRLHDRKWYLFIKK